MAYFSKTKIIKILNYVIFNLKKGEYANLGICKISGNLEEGLWFSNNYRIVLHSFFSEKILKDKLEKSVFRDFVLNIVEYDSDIPSEIILNFSESNISFDIPENYELEYLNYNYAQVEDCTYHLCNNLSFPRVTERYNVIPVAKSFICDINSNFIKLKTNIFFSQISMNFSELNYVLGIDSRGFDKEYFSSLINDVKNQIVEKYNSCSNCKVNLEFSNQTEYLLVKIQFCFGIDLYFMDVKERELFKRKILLMPTNIPKPKISFAEDNSNQILEIVHTISKNIKNSDLKKIFDSVKFEELDNKVCDKLLLINDVIQKYEILKHKGFNPNMDVEIDDMIEAFLNSIDGLNNESMEELSLKAEIKGLTNFFATQSVKSKDFNIN